MSKREKQFYCKLGQAVTNVFGALIFVIVPMLLCNLGGYIASIIL